MEVIPAVLTLLGVFVVCCVMQRRDDRRIEEIEGRIFAIEQEVRELKGRLQDLQVEIALLGRELRTIRERL